jgi:Helix-turn-helix domain
MPVFWLPEGYLHLTCEQRCQIYALLQSGHSQAHIARKIGVDPSTISRELVRNTGARGYRFKQAHEKARGDARRPRTDSFRGTPAHAGMIVFAASGDNDASDGGPTPANVEGILSVCRRKAANPAASLCSLIFQYPL